MENNGEILSIKWGEDQSGRTERRTRWKRGSPRFWRWVSFYALTLAICMGTMGLLALVIALPNWHLAAVGIWYLVCLASLCFPEDFPDRWLSGRR